MNGPTVLSTFSGVGGLDLGLARSGWRHAGLCEADEYRRAVLAERFPGVECADDVRRVAAEPRAVSRSRRDSGAVPRPDARPDLLAGGFPCQDLSVAGRRRGLAGERSGLFFEFARIAESVRPRWLLIENVPGLFSSNSGRDFGELLGALADLGYGVAWRVLDSRFFGVPQRRRRVFIVGCDLGGRAGAERAGEVLAVGSGCGGHPAARGEAGSGVAGGVADGAGGPDVVSALTRNGVGAGGGPDDNAAQAGHLVTTPTLTASWANNGGTGGHDGRDDAILSMIRARPGQGVRRLTPVECERLQGFPDGWTDIPWNGKPHAPDSRRYAALGDAVTVPVAEWLGRRLIGAMALEEAA